MLKININENKKINLCDDSIQIFLSLISHNKKVAFFESSHEEAIKLKNKIKLFDPLVKVLIFPDFDCTFFSNISPTKPILLERIKTLIKLLTKHKDRIIFIGTINSLVTKTILKEKLNFFDVFNQSKNRYLKLSQYLKKNNYEFVDTVRNKCECSIRGQIIDIFSPIENKPIRILYNLDEVESVNFFDTHTQSNSGIVKNYLISPTSEIVFSNDSIKYFRESFRKLRIKDKDDFYKSISNKDIIPGSEQFYPILYEKYDSIINYLDGFDFFFRENSNIDFEEKLKQVVSEIPSYVKEVINESEFYENKNIIKDHFLKKNTSLFTKISNNSETFIFSEKLLLNSKKNENLKNINKFFSSLEFNKFFFCYDGIINKKKNRKTF